MSAPLVDTIGFCAHDAVCYLRAVAGSVFGGSAWEFVRKCWVLVLVEFPRFVLPYPVVLLRHLWLGRRPRRHPTVEPLVSVVVPALNEEDTIECTVLSLGEQTWRNMEVIVVDDGSTDGTTAVCRRLAREGRIRFFRLDARQGKSAALNLGTHAAKGEYVVYVDSDTTFDRNAVECLIASFDDDRVGAAQGDVRVRNFRANILTRLQAMEYLTCLAVGRRFQALVGTLLCIAGAFGAFPRRVLDRVGGHEPGPGNDSDLTVRVRKLGLRAVHAEGAVCHTTVPETPWALIRQRMRWNRSIVRLPRRHRDVWRFWGAGHRIGIFAGFLDRIVWFGWGVSWLVYVADISLSFPYELSHVLAADVLLHVGLRYAQFAMALAICERAREYVGLLLYVPIYPLYATMNRIVWLIAIAEEALFRTSYHDTFAPPNVRREIEVF